MMACDTAAHLTLPHFAALGIAVTLRYGMPSFESPSMEPEEFRDVCNRRLEELLGPLREVMIGPTALKHLSAAGCVAVRAYAASKPIPGWTCANQALTELERRELPFCRETAMRWNQSVWGIGLTTVGDVIGLAVLDASGANVGLRSWIE